MTTSAPAARWSAATLSGAAAMPAESWNALARRGFHLHQWFRAAEASGWRARHVVASEGEEVRAVFPAYLTGAETPHDLHERWLGPLRGIERFGLALRPVLSVQSPLSLTSDALGDVATLPHWLIERMFERLEETAAAERARAVVWPFVDAHDEAVIAVARGRGYAVVPSGVTARLRVWWDTFEEYVASRSKSVRRTIRGDLDSLARAGLETRATTDFRARAPEMDALYRDAYRRRNGREPRLNGDWLHRLAAEPTPGVVALLTASGGRLAGMSLNLGAGAVFDGTLAAFGHREQGGPAYLNDLVYQPVRLACAHGIGTIDLGMSALYPKVLRGARLRRRVALVRGWGAGRHRALAALGALVARRQEAKERRMLGPLWGPRCYEDGEDLP